ncbi:MAG: InlB B-repeat-containing protein, partial [Thermodesulfobacteriota bacterium]
MKKPLHYTAFIIVLILTAATGCILDDDSGDNNKTARENTTTLTVRVADKQTGKAAEDTTVDLQRQSADRQTTDSAVSSKITDDTGRVRFTVTPDTRYFLDIAKDGYYDIHGHLVETKEKDKALTIKIVSTDNADNTFTVDPADADTLTDIGTEYTAVDINHNAVANLLKENGIQQITVRQAAASEVTAARGFLNADERAIGSYVTFSFSETDTDLQSLQATNSDTNDFSGFIEAAIALNLLSTDPEMISPGNYHLMVVIKNANGKNLFRQPVIRTDGQYLYGQIPLVYKGDLADSIMVFLTYAAEREQQPASTEIVSVEDVETREVDYDTALADIALPDRVTVTRGDGLTANVSVNWDRENISPAYAPRQPGEYLITGALDIEDFSNLTNPETVSVSVIVKVGPPPNRAPVLQAPENKSIAENEELKFTVSAEDADEDPLTYTAGGDLAGRFDPETATFQWKPGYEDSGEYQLSVTVSDGALTDSETVAIAVENTDRAPVLDPIGDKTVTENNELGFTVAASDPDGDPVTLSAASLPAGAGFDPETGQFSWIPGDNQAGSHEIAFTATANGLRDSKTVTIHVEESVILTVTTRGEGTVTPAAGPHDYREGETVRCTASPAPGYVFSHWEVGIVDKSDDTITVTMDQDKTVTAIFQEVFYDLNIAADGTGSVTPAAGHHTFHKDKQVSLTATPGAQCNFSHWRGDVADPNSAETTVTMDD